jgi:glutamine amidotransferase
MTLALIDYDRGNLRSVEKALEQIGAEVSTVESGEELEGARPESIVLPGVGAFGDAMKNLADRGLVEPIREWIRADRPFLGICLGYQLLFSSSEESPGVDGLGVLEGAVVKFSPEVGVIPHMGWNRVALEAGAGHPLRPAFQDAPFFYHVHSFFPQFDLMTTDAQCRTEYGGISFASGVIRGRLAAFQFHPEKSQEAGLNLLRSVVRYWEL